MLILMELELQLNDIDYEDIYDNVEVDDFDAKGVYFSNDKYAPYVAYDKIVEINVRNVPE